MPKAITPPDRYHSNFLADLDKRTGIAQSLSAQWDTMCNDLGGVERLSLAQRMLIERALWMHYWLQREEEKLANGTGNYDPGKHAAVTNTLQGVLAKLGLQRQARDVPSIADFIAQRRSA